LNQKIYTKLEKITRNIYKKIVTQCTVQNVSYTAS